MTATMKTLGVLGVMVACSTASWASHHWEAHSDHASDSEEYDYKNRGEPSGGERYFVPPCDASDVKADSDDSEKKKKRKYTAEQLLEIRESVEPDPRVEAILSGMGILKFSPEENK